MSRNPELEKLQEEVEKWKQIAHTDALTGVYDRRGIEGFIHNLMKSKLKSTAVVYFDIDNFKKQQDERSHDWGDQALVHFAYALQGSVRKDSTDAVGRHGGDEFCMVLPGARDQDIKLVLNRLWQNLDINPVPSEKDSLRLQTTYGIAVYPSVPYDKLLSVAKRKMEIEKKLRKRGR